MRLVGWETIAAALACAASIYFLPSTFYASVVGEVITFLSLLMAAIVPTMMLAATSLRAGNFSVQRIQEYTSALERQINLFGGLFAYALLASAIAISGQAFGWQIGKLADWELATLLQGGLTFMLCFLALRALSVIAGVKSILRLTAAIALQEAADRVAVDYHSSELSSYQTPQGYGEAVDLGRDKTK